jgi:hypothetical protein
MMVSGTRKWRNPNKGETAMMTEISKQTAKFVARIAENLPSELDETTMQGWIDNPRGLQKFLHGLCPPSAFKVWKRILLGTAGLKTADDFRHALKDDGNRIGDWGDDILGKPAFTASSEETEVNLVVASVAELGFKDGATREDIYKRAQELGLELCPPEVGPQLRLQYKDQPKGELLIIGMEPIAASDKYLNLFCVEHLDVCPCLCGTHGHPYHLWGGFSRFVFISRK